jgi:hypothetical protein
MSRRRRRREAAQRYQDSPRGRLKHAARMACWRERQRRSRRRDACSVALDKVTHQGCVDAGVQAPLLACDTPSASQASIGTDPLIEAAPASAEVPAAAVSATLRCRRCLCAVLPHVRLGWLRPRSVHRSRAHDHPS